MFEAANWLFGRARFQAIRASFEEEWQPKGGIEGALIDTMAIAFSAYLFWMERLHGQSVRDANREARSYQKNYAWEGPRATDLETMEQSGAMVDRFNRLFLRSLRALRDLRRYAPTVLVQNAGQVNVGAQQVNVSQPPPGTP